MAGQETKREFEQNISKDDFPPMILHAMQPILTESKRTKYIEEYDDTLHTYEVKTKWNDRWLSIEFFADYSLMDIEEIYDFNNLDGKVKPVIETYLSDSFRKFKITRTQIQFSSINKRESIERSILHFKNGDMEHFQRRYEIVARVISHNKKTIGSFEFLFNRNGELIRWRREKKMLTDNVLF